jgi:hypothetical protein
MQDALIAYHYVDFEHDSNPRLVGIAVAQIFFISCAPPVAMCSPPVAMASTTRSLVMAHSRNVLRTCSNFQDNFPFSLDALDESS